MFYNFIITNPKKYSLSESDILVEGEKCLMISNKLIKFVSSTISAEHKPIATPTEHLQKVTLINKLKKLNCMIEQSPEVIMTKFVNSIWQKYTFFSELGEQFLSLDDMVKFFQYLKREDLMTTKVLEKEYRI